MPGRSKLRYLFGLGRGGISLARAERRLRVVSTLFFFALLVPVGILIDTIYSQLDNEAVFQLRNESERVIEQVNRRIAETVAAEENRPFNDYSFFNVTELPLVQQKRLAISPLAQAEPAGAPPGLVGYFQVDPTGGFSSPVVPSSELSEADTRSLGISPEEVLKRTDLRDKLYALLFSGEPVRPTVLAPDTSATQLADNLPALAGGRAKTEEIAAASPGAAQAGAAAEKGGANDNAAAVDKFAQQQLAQNDLPQQALSKQALNAQIEQAQPEQFLNSQVGTFQGKKVSDLNLEGKWAAKAKAAPSSLSKLDQYMSKSKDSYSRKKVQVDTAAPENRTRDLYANYGSVAQEDAPQKATSGREELKRGESSIGNIFRSQDQPKVAASAPRAQRDSRIAEADIALAQGVSRTPEREVQAARQAHDAAPAVKILSFEAEIEPFRARALPDRRIVFFRNVWRENRRYIQGFVVDGPAFLRQLLDTPIAGSALSSFANIIVAYADEVFETLRSNSPPPQQGKRELLISSDKLASPLNSFGLLITAGRLPEAPGRRLVDILSFGLLGIVLVGQWALYAIARKQIRLAKERSDFVSAVSHELKTPLTSIRMYAEMLREGWVGDEEKKHGYYDFIFRESERLSRLIGNVLDFSRLSNSPGSKLELKRIEPPELFTRAREKIAVMIASAGFKLDEELSFGPPELEAAPAIMADEDSFIRVIINLVDNAIKFSAQAQDKRVVFGLRLRTGGAAPEVIFSVRDFGPGVPREKMKKIFTLFYRGTDEMTRTTQGTGIGLALVKELAEKMNARIDLSNQQPGAQFEVVFQPEKNGS